MLRGQLPCCMWATGIQLKQDLLKSLKQDLLKSCRAGRLLQGKVQIQINQTGPKKIVSEYVFSLKFPFL